MEHTAWGSVEFQGQVVEGYRQLPALHGTEDQRVDPHPGIVADGAAHLSIVLRSQLHELAGGIADHGGAAYAHLGGVELAAGGDGDHLHPALGGADPPGTVGHQLQPEAALHGGIRGIFGGADREGAPLLSAAGILHGDLAGDHLAVDDEAGGAGTDLPGKDLGVHICPDKGGGQRRQTCPENSPQPSGVVLAFDPGLGLGGAGTADAVGARRRAAKVPDARLRAVICRVGKIAGAALVGLQPEAESLRLQLQLHRPEMLRAQRRAAGGQLQLFIA